MKKHADLNRRRVLQSGLALPLTAEAASAAPVSTESVYTPGCDLAGNANAPAPGLV